MRIAMCDDEELCRTQIIEILQVYTEQNKDKDICFNVFKHADELLEAVRKTGGFDIYILDIVMPEINGIELGVALRDAGCDGKIIYLTSSEEYAIDAFRAKAFNYILKPPEKNALWAALDEALLSISNKIGKNLLVKTKENSVKLNFDSIMYAQLAKRAIIYHLSNGNTVDSVQIRTSFLEAVNELLGDSRFVMCGASMIANMHHITMVENDALIFKDANKVYLGKKACREVRSAWYDFWFDGEGSK